MIGDSETYPCMDVIKHIYKCDDHFYQILLSEFGYCKEISFCGNDILRFIDGTNLHANCGVESSNELQSHILELQSN